MPTANSTNTYHLSENKSLRRESQRLRRFINDKGLKSVLLGISGGPDSVLAFHLLRMASENIPDFRLGIAHANFNLRGDESLRDENFVRALAKKYPEVDAHFISFETDEYCQKKGISTEMGARELRHRWFDELRNKLNYDRIATGHNADDNEETLLLNLLRGSGTRGLRGMESDNGRIIRPLLQLHRKEVLSMIEALPDDLRSTTPYIIDSSNLTDNYRRNFLRHKIIPLLESRWEGTHTALQTTLRLMDEEYRIVEDAIERALTGSETLLSWETLQNFPSPFTLIYRWITPYGGTPTLAAEMASAISNNQENARTGGRWQLKDIEITATTSGLRLIHLDSLSASNVSLITGKNPPNVIREQIMLTDSNRKEMMNRIKHSSAQTAYLPGTPDDYEWRNPYSGERMRTGQKESKLITRILKESGVTAILRSSIWLLSNRATGKPIWIPGIRRGFDNRITGKEDIITMLSLPEL